MRKKLNVKLVGWLLGGVVALSTGTILLHGYQVRRNATTLRSFGRGSGKQ